MTRNCPFYCKEPTKIVGEVTGELAVAGSDLFQEQHRHGN